MLCSRDVDASLERVTSSVLRRLVTMDSIPQTSGIYKITCTANKKIYIGSAFNLRQRRNRHFRNLRQNTHINQNLQNSWNKYGEQAFIFEVLELVLEMNCIAREQYWLNKLKPFGKKGFNIAYDASSPMLGRKARPETIEKIRQSQIGKKKSPEHIEKVRQANTGRKNTLEAIERMRQAHLVPEVLEKHIKDNRGHKKSAQAIENMRQASLGRKRSSEAIEKIRQASFARKRDEKGKFV